MHIIKTNSQFNIITERNLVMENNKQQNQQNNNQNKNQQNNQQNKNQQNKKNNNENF